MEVGDATIATRRITLSRPARSPRHEPASGRGQARIADAASLAPLRDRGRKAARAGVHPQATRSSTTSFPPPSQCAGKASSSRA